MARGPEVALGLELERPEQRRPAPGQRRVLGDAGDVTPRSPARASRPASQRRGMRQSGSRSPSTSTSAPGSASATQRSTASHSSRSRRRLRSTVGVEADVEARGRPRPPAPRRSRAAGPAARPRPRTHSPSRKRTRAARVTTSCRQRASATRAWPPSTAHTSPGAVRRASGRGAISRREHEVGAGGIAQGAPPAGEQDRQPFGGQSQCRGSHELPACQAGATVTSL